MSPLVALLALLVAIWLAGVVWLALRLWLGALPALAGFVLVLAGFLQIIS